MLIHIEFSNQATTWCKQHMQTNQNLTFLDMDLSYFH